jgi:hypothetical protein
MGKRRGAVAAATILNRCTELGDGRRGVTTLRTRTEREMERGGSRTAPGRQRPETGERGRRGAAMPRGQPNRGGGRGADRWAMATVPGSGIGYRQARAAQCRV